MLVSQALGLDVARSVEVALDEALAASERCDGLADGGVVQLWDLLDRPGHLEPAATPAERGLDRDRETVLLGEGDHLVGPGHRVGRSGDLGSVDRLGDVPRLDLVAERADGGRRGADPGEPGVDDGLGEVGVLVVAQERGGCLLDELLVPTLQ